MLQINQVAAVNGDGTIMQEHLTEDIFTNINRTTHPLDFIAKTGFMPCLDRSASGGLCLSLARAGSSQMSELAGSIQRAGGAFAASASQTVHNLQRCVSMLNCG